MRWLLILVLTACACAGLESPNAYRYGYGMGVGCEAGDVDCEEVERHLDTVHAEWGHWCATVWLGALMDLAKMGDRAVPTLVRELGAESRIHARFAARHLMRTGHLGKVIAWCDAHPGHENRDLVCGQGPPSLTPPRA